ncbi:MAG: diguanylate cyclase [Thermodesulfobacteriota bacterium]
MKKGKILVVDDDAFFRVLCSDILKGGDFLVKTASSGREAIGIIESEPVDIVITDLVMPGVSGLEVLQRTKQHNTLTDVIVITGHGSIESAVSALKSGASDYIRKPLNEDELLHTVTRCMEKKKLLEENIEMRQSLKLFEVSRAVASTLEISRLYNITLDALLQIVPAQAGIMVFFNDGGDGLDIKAIRHMGLEIGEKIVEALEKNYRDEIRGLKTVKVLTRDGLRGTGWDALGDDTSLLVAPLSKGNATVGFAIVLSGPATGTPFSSSDVNNAAFVAEHAAAAFENARKYAEAKEMAFIDSLTNLYNSKYLEMALDKELKRADRLVMPVTVLFLDLDNFKRINDTNDHLVGSKMLVETGKILLKCVREVDTVVRYGGDEYVIVLVDADYNVASRVAERIRETIEKTRFLSDESLDIRVTASIGIATYPLHTRDKKELLKIADKAMYRAKDLSRNTVYLAPLPGVGAAKK